jgi:hypothetical protein
MPRVVNSIEHWEIQYTKTSGDINTESQRLKLKDDIFRYMLKNLHKFLQDPVRYLEYSNVKW